MIKVIVGMSSLYLSKAHLHGNYTLSDFSTRSALQSHVTCQESQENGFPDVSVRDHKDVPFQDAMENACGSVSRLRRCAAWHPHQQVTYVVVI